jgi:hypothetical protein
MAVIHEATHLIHIVAEDAFGVANTGGTSLTSAGVSQPCWDIQEVPKRAAIEHAGNRTNYGRRAPIIGLPEGDQGFTCYLEGLGTAYPTDPAAASFLSTMFVGVLDASAVLTDGATINTGEGGDLPTYTYTAVELANPPGAGGVACVVTDTNSRVEVRNVVSHATSSPDVSTLGMASGGDYSDGAITYGMAYVALPLMHSAKQANTLQLRATQLQGSTSEPNDCWESYGWAPNVVYNAVGRGEVQTLTFSGPAAGFDHDIASALTAPAGTRPLPAAHSTFEIAEAGTNKTASIMTIFNYELNLNLTRKRIPPTVVDGTLNASGYLNACDPMLKVTFVHDDAAGMGGNPPGSSADWEAAFTNGDSFQFHHGQGTTAANLGGWFLWDMVPKGEPTYSSVDGIRAATVEFQANHATTSPVIFTEYQG